MNRALRIALIVRPIAWYNRQMIAGILSYSREHGPWRFIFQPRNDDDSVAPWVARSEPDGVLASITAPRMARQLGRLGVPVVDLLQESGRVAFPRIVCDDQEAVRRAVDHLLERHLRNLAYVGRRDTTFSRKRRVCFRDYIAKRRREVKAATGATLRSADILLPWVSMPHLRLDLADWLRSLPKPVGVVACNDVWGAQVIRACHEHDLRVPDDVAVIGIDDDPEICGLSTPMLSSIGVNSQAIGYRAAAMLHGMIERGLSPPPITFVEPGPVQPRASTDTVAIEDAEVVAAVRHLREKACPTLTASTAAAKLGMSRRTLERLFTRHVGHSPAVEITHARLARARDLLIGSSLSLEDIARSAGFFHVETLHRVFKRRYGIAPGRYRRVHGLKPSAILLSTARLDGQPGPAKATGPAKAPVRTRRRSRDPSLPARRSRPRNR